jgi:hypothetical protein
LPVGGLEWLGLSPAVGITAMTVIGTALGRLDVSLGGVGGVFVMLAIAAVGWVPGFPWRRQPTDDRDAEAGELREPAPDSPDTHR